MEVNILKWISPELTSIIDDIDKLRAFVSQVSFSIWLEICLRELEVNMA